MAFAGWLDRIRSRWRPEGAQTMAEYGIVLAVITPAIILSYGLLSDKVAELINLVRAILT